MLWKASAALLAAALAAVPAAAQQDRPGIEVQELGAVDPFQIGVLDALPDQVWSSSDGEALRALLLSLPDGEGPGWSSPLAARLAQRALLSSGQPPQGARGDFGLAALRADRALAAGRAEPVYRLLERTPRVQESALLSRIYAETAFALGHTAQACRAAETLLRERNEPYWLRARAACLAMAGDIAAAELTADFARGAETRAPGFEALFDAIALGRNLPADVRPSTGLELAMAVHLDDEAEIRIADGAPVWLVRAAERTGPPIDLPSDPSEALEAAMMMEGAARSAALAALIQQDADREIAAEALAVRFEEAAADGLFVEIARGYAPEISTMPITAETLAHGERFTLALILAGDHDGAREWRDALTRGPRPARPSGPSSLGGFELSEGGGPASLAPPPASFEAYDDEPWEGPSPSVMVGIDFVFALARGELTSDPFQALFAARVEDADRWRLAEAAALGALGASVPGEARAALLALEEEAAEAGEGSPVRAGSALLAGGAGALAEAQLHAARLIEVHGDDPDAWAVAAAALAAAGLRDEALRLVIEGAAEEAA
jgi:hypothetical protein